MIDLFDLAIACILFITFSVAYVTFYGYTTDTERLHWLTEELGLTREEIDAEMKGAE